MKIYTTGQIAKMLNVAPRTVCKWIDSNNLVGFKIPSSKDRRVSEGELVKFIYLNKFPIPEELQEVNNDISIFKQLDAIYDKLKHLKHFRVIVGFLDSIPIAQFEIGQRVYTFNPLTQTPQEFLLKILSCLEK